jgi:formyltetrahydrofolate deformylase
MPENSFILKLSCDDKPGIVAAVTTELAERNANIVESNQFWDRQTNRFFLRVAFTTPPTVDREELERALKPASDRFGMKVEFYNSLRRPKIIIMVSKADHALQHLLYQIEVGWLNAEVVAIVSNHEDSRRSAESREIPYYCWPVNKENKAEQEDRLLHLFRETGAELVILARYMQVLSDELSKRLFGMIINIHQSLAKFQRCKALSPGLRTRRQANRCHRALCDGGSG